MTLESPLDSKEIQPVHSEGDQPWDFFGRTDAKAETPVLWPPHAKSWLMWKRPWCWETLRIEGERDDRGWDCWMASLTQWRWVWVNSGSWWWTGRPGMLQSMGSQRVGHDLSDWTELRLPLLGEEMATHSTIPAWHNTPPHGQRSLAAYSPYGCTESEWLKWQHVCTQDFLSSILCSWDLGHWKEFVLLLYESKRCRCIVGDEIDHLVHP